MGFIGNIKGPKKSELVLKLGADYFGITKNELLVEIEYYKEEEANGEIDPVFEDKNGNCFLLFNAPQNKTQKFYFDLKDYNIKGEVKTIKYENNNENEIDVILNKAKIEISRYLKKALKENTIDFQLYEKAKSNVIHNITKWLNDPNIDEISPNAKIAIINAVNSGKNEDLINAFWKEVSFGTGGIRGLMAKDKESILKLKKEGLDATILKGPNTLNNIMILKMSAGIAKFGLDKGYNKVVIGYDSRIRGLDFALLIAELFLAYGYTIYLFDEPCPYPEVTFAVPFSKINAHLGIMISASHNDFRYNGYKLSCQNGSQFDPEDREKMYFDYIVKSDFGDITLKPLEKAEKGKLFFLGGENCVEDFNYYGFEDKLINIHEEHGNHIKSFLLLNRDSKKDNRNLNIAYCAYHGAGRVAVPRLLREIGFKNINVIRRDRLNELDGMFPSFNDNPGSEQQPDPGDPRAAAHAVDVFKKEYPGKWTEIDLLIGTDPDADRCGVVVKVPENQQFLYDNKDYMLLPADDMWALLLWFRLKFDKEITANDAFIVLSHTTSDCIVKMAEKNGIGIIKTWVGFAALAAAARDSWNNDLPYGIKEGKNKVDQKLCNPFIQELIAMNSDRKHNIAAMEQSNGFSILGYPPPNEYSLGVRGHVRDKDGTFAAILIAEIAEWAKREGSSLFELIDEYIFLDPQIGLFMNLYEPDPLDGEYPGIVGDKKKNFILKKALDFQDDCSKRKLSIGGYSVVSTTVYRTGKYDFIYPPTPEFQFPDEGIRFYFSKDKMNHLTIRPSGTTNSMRFHVQLYSKVDKKNLIDRKKELLDKGGLLLNNFREIVDAPNYL